MNSALFANQSRERMMTNNFCISPYEVHGKSIQLAAKDFRLLEDCDDEDVGDPVADKPLETELLETTKPSTLLSSSRVSSRSCFEFVVGLLLVLLFVQCKAWLYCIFCFPATHKKQTNFRSIVSRIGNSRVAGQNCGARIVGWNRPVAGHAFWQFVDWIGSVVVVIVVVGAAGKLRPSIEPVLVLWLLPQLSPPLQ